MPFLDTREIDPGPPLKLKISFELKKNYQIQSICSKVTRAYTFKRNFTNECWNSVKKNTCDRYENILMMPHRMNEISVKNFLLLGQPIRNSIIY